ncbi:MAG: hypothetical protein JNL28_09105 [Planctomycetes bacterium]|nr:hypothetical protein [Planctomycetota bacterium]
MATINNGMSGPRKVQDGELTVDITRPNRQMNEAAFKEVEERRAHDAEARAKEAARIAARPDRIEVSSEARLMLARSEAGRRDEAVEHKQRVADLREQYLEGKLVTQERVEKAAESILGD